MAKSKRNPGINFELIERTMRENPADWFSSEETERRMAETMARMSGRPRTMNMKTGQNLQPPFLGEADLTRRGYPCDPGFE